MRRLALLLVSLAAALAWPAAAQDIPGRVGRLAWTEGTVALYQDPDRGWDEAYLNSPLTSQNSVWTEPGARAEVQVGATALRLDSASQLDIARLDDTVLDATLEQGEMNVRIRHFFPGDTMRLSTPQATFLLRAAGRYRIESDPDSGESRLAVFAGDARLEGANVRVAAGQSLVVWGGDQSSYAVQAAYTTDFDRWAMTRDAHWVEARAPTYVSYEMTGYEDLDAYGSWSTDPTYGTLWYPRDVAADWAPYREGRWAYVSPWGWTWVDAAPWGYAPFHYGRWVQVRDRWAWCPGHRVDRPAWAPALVGFVGGAGFAASAGAGPVVGWYPLAPSEPYRPWYTAGSGYVKRVNAVVVNVPDAVARQHREVNRERGATAVRRDTIVAQQPIARARVQLAAAQLRSAPPAAAPAAVLPSRAEVRQAHERNAGRGPRPAGPPAGIARNAPQATPAAQGANPAARPQFTKPRSAPKPAPRDAAAPPANAPLARATARPAEREAAQQQQRQAQERTREEQQRNSQQQRTAQQQAQEQQQERAHQEQQRTAQDRSRQEQQRAAQQQRDAQQQQERVTREANQQQERTRQEQQRTAQQQQERARAEQQRTAQQQQDRARAEQQRVAQQDRDAQQQQQRAAQQAQREAQQQQQHAAQQAREAQQQQQHAAQQAQQQQERAAEQAQREAQQQQQQRAAEQAQGEAQQQQQHAAQQAQQQQQRAAQQAQREAQQQQQRAAQEQQRAGQQAQQEAQQARQRAEGARQREDRGQARAEDRNPRDPGHGEGG